jgi:hypothetical protein
MIIEIENIPFSVEYDTDDGELYLSSAKLNDYELIDVLTEEVKETIEKKLIFVLEEENEDSKYDGAIDDYDFDSCF